MKLVFLSEIFIEKQRLINLLVAVAPRTGKFIKNSLRENLLQIHIATYCTLCLGSTNRQKSSWKVKIYVNKKPTFLQEACHLKG